ncbi:hypothetical protein NW768_008111 [Fusarium equiseti]|uniref:Uncharacterized protein n=1 Tax=Fusarium equiseti TaxID=61235 RepID=A0ABQ8R5T9_FUSEQ|nr:hypothetical protein NW768_008111 [Fusarium equiseti]
MKPSRNSTMKPSNTIRSTIEIPKIQKLESPDQWLDWYAAVRSIARGLEIWHTMDPKEEDQDNDRAVPPKVESYSALRNRTLKEAREEDRTPPSEDTIIMLHSSLCKEAEIKMELYRERSQKEQAMRSLIMTSVPVEIYKSVMDKATTIKHGNSFKRKSKHTLRQLLRVLQDAMTLPEKETKQNIIKEYHELYDEAGRDGLSYNQFRIKWTNIIIKILDTMGPVVASYGGDEEATRAMKSLKSWIQWPHGRPTYSDSTDWKADAVSLLSLGMLSLEHVLAGVGINTLTLDDVRWRRDASGLFLCPCFKQKHRWTPEECGNVRWAITGRPVKGIKKPSASQRQDIREAMQDPKWATIRDCYIIQGHDLDPY